MIRLLLLSFLAVVPIVSSILSSYNNGQLMGLLESSQAAADSYPEWALQSSKTVKKYDRNCFFSPVQCMLSFNHAQEHPIVFTENGKRFYYRK
uniref:Exported protein n=1 Tax=Angiostrongylus cantonensis TaxID=6313 RepID=A0A0K0DG53_ANGCA